VHEGAVAFADQFTGYGNLVILDHGTGAYSLYGHFRPWRSRAGTASEEQGVVARRAATPAVTPPCTLSWRVDGKPVDPLQWLKKQP